MSTRRLPKFPEPLSTTELQTIARNQDAILDWLRSRGHAVVGTQVRRGEDYRRWRGCESKRRFSSAGDALKNNPGMHVYECDFCNGFHLTSSRS